MTQKYHQIVQSFPVRFSYSVYFTERLFAPENDLFESILVQDGDSGPRKALFVIDSGVAEHHPHLIPEITRRSHTNRGVWHAVGGPIILPGGEALKNDSAAIDLIHERINAAGMCRHSYVVAFGGGGVLDAVGFAAATAHRGLRMIRVPTTVLSQNDSGVGVKNGINAFGKKNFLGAFAPPYAVVIDNAFLRTLDERDWRAGISEAIKVALIKDRSFFDFLEASAGALASREEETMRHLIYRCAELHLEHIRTSGDPFEAGSSRPLDFGHWAAHKLEQMTDYELRHGEAVAIGIALDCTYAHLSGLLHREAWDRIVRLLESVGFNLSIHDLLRNQDRADRFTILFDGLEEFREHLGGDLTLLMVTDIGSSIEVHYVDRDRYVKAIELLAERTRHEVDV